MNNTTLRLRWTLAALLLTCSLQVPAFSAGSSSTRRQIQAQYERQSQAFTSGDVDAIAAQMAPDYTAEWNGRTINREQSIDTARRLVNMLKYRGAMSIIIRRFSSTGSRAIASISQIASVVIQGSKGQHRIMSRSTSRQTWVHTSDGWKIRHVVLLGLHATLDGRPVKLDQSPMR